MAFRSRSRPNITSEKKGAVLTAFLQKTSVSPKVIALVDDRKKNIDDVEQSLKNYYPEIKFVEIYYQGAFTNSFQNIISGEEFKNFWENLANKARAFIYEQQDSN